MSQFTSDAQSYPKAPTRDRLYTRWGHLKTERATWWAHWQELSTYLLPRSGRFFVQDRNKGWRRHNSIYDNTGTRALKVLGAGMMAGATSPARPWFRMMTGDPDLAKYQPVRIWLDEVGKLMQMVFQKSNTYRALHSMYEELGVFGTAATILLPNFNNVIHNYSLTAGEYCVATDYQGQVCTLYREYERPVSEVVKEFGYKNCSEHVRNLYDRGSLDQWIRIIHAIEPRADRDINKLDNKNMAWGSYHFEIGARDNQFLRESGFKRFPGLVPRWAVAGGDIYGHSPGMECLGDIKQLQHEQLRKAQGIDFKSNPPIQVPTSLKNREVDRLPGGVTYFDPSSPQSGVKSLFEVNIDLNHLLQDIQDVRGRVNSSFYTDMFLMLSNGADQRMTATEVAERHEEKLLMLGPVLERLHNELLTPLIETTFQTMIESGIVPPAPQEMHGMELNVEFISMLAQAQKAVGANSIDRFVGNLGAVAQFKPEALDKFDADAWVDAYSDMLGVDPSLIVAGDKVAMVRQQRAQAQQQQAQMMQAEQQAKISKDLASAKTTEPSALTNVIDMFSGYNTPQAM